MGLVISLALAGGGSVTAETWRLNKGERWDAVAAGSREQYAHALAEIKQLAQAGNLREVKQALKRLEEEFPERVGPDLELFIFGELWYWRNRYGKALVKYEKLLKDYPGSEFAAPVLERESDMAQAYLRGRKIVVLGILPLSGHAEGIEIMEKISDRAGLDEPNGVGLRAAIAVAEHYEARQQYVEAYLKWSEIASYWERGAIGRRALYRMAENNLAAYDQRAPEKRHYYDASKLTTAKTYYERFLLLYPEEAKGKEIPQKIRYIDEQMAHKQFTIGQFYRRTGEPRAANLYFDMVITNWPQTEAAALAKQALAEDQAGGK